MIENYEDGKPRMVEFATIKMTVWAFVVLVVGLICSLYTVIFIPKVGFYIGLLLLTSTVIGAYNINCLFVGNCFLFAKALVIYYVIVLVTTLLTYIGLKQYTNNSVTTAVNRPILSNIQKTSGKLLSPVLEKVTKK
jgi:predicted membrane protein